MVAFLFNKKLIKQIFRNCSKYGIIMAKKQKKANKGEKVMYNILVVDDDKEIVKAIEIYLGKENILKMIEKNEESILKMYDKAYENSKDNELFLYLGEKYFIEIKETEIGIRFDGDTVYAPSMKALELFYKTEVQRVFTSEVEIAKKCFSNLPEFTLKFRSMLTRWGVCNPSKKTVTLNTELLKKDIDL